MLPIMDVSRWQGRIDWDKVKASGLVSGVMLRALGNSAEDKPSKPYIDPTFERNYAECQRLGIPVGVYYYCKAVNTAEADAELALLRKVLTGKTVQLPVAVDIEDTYVQAPLDKQTLTDIAAHALAAIEQMGFYAMLYTGLYFGQTNLYMGGAALKKYDVWLARYPKDKTKTKPEDKPKTDFAFGMWQYTSTVRVPGVSGNVDLSHAYKNYAKIIAKKGLTRLREGA
uniref:lysozyme n=1 Tax=Myoviridae sp. ctCjb12 TaxID=2826631 RepID=A0A8S5MQG5_9CAUD|nr:MAG TPA: PlyB like endolysin [Myoviridae sp. ctCjb12]